MMLKKYKVREELKEEEKRQWM